MANNTLSPEETAYFCNCLVDVFSSYFGVTKAQARYLFTAYGVIDYVANHRAIGHSNNECAMNKIASVIEYNGGPKFIVTAKC